MFFPIGDAPNSRGAALVTWLLIAANVAVYLLFTLPLDERRPNPRDPALAAYVRTVSQALRGAANPAEIAREATQYDLFVFAHGFRPAAPSPASLFTCMFLHAGLLHLAGNMLFLWIYGDNVEHRLGAAPYLAAYLGGGLAATLFHALVSAGSGLPLIGASGAISGVLGFYFVWFPRNRVRVLLLFPPFLLRVFEVPARLVLGVYLVLENLVPFLSDATPSGVAHGAHIGGFVAGLAAAVAIDRFGLSNRAAAYPAAPGAPPASPTAVHDALVGGRPDLAASAYFALPERQSRGLLAPGEAFELARGLRGAGQPRAALVVLRRALRDAPQGAATASLHLAAGTLLLSDLAQPTLAYQELCRALDGEPGPQIGALARAALEQIEAGQKGRPPRRT